ncbi:helix-turn-helix transcriptional regulator (plasmid) [Streptomyces sp. NBC_00161]|uniref:helix-turn-helix domain-containing protein n=1 Tax=Streptomyces sp. NBC_00161 TaxID=2975671 RepID=UPI002F907BA4
MYIASCNYRCVNCSLECTHRLCQTLTTSEGGKLATPKATTTLQSVLAKRLTDWRMQAAPRISRSDAAQAVGVTPHTVRRWEIGESNPPRTTIEKLLDLYGATAEEITGFLAEVEQAKQPSWWASYPAEVLPRNLHRFLSLESAATVIRAFEPYLVPALLRTEDYARAALSACHPGIGADLLDRHIDLLQERQRRILGTRPGTPEAAGTTRPILWVVLDESALRRSVGGPQVMHQQIEHLLAMAKQPEIKIQIVPQHLGAYPGTEAGPFHLFRFAEPELPDIVYRSSFDGGEYLHQKTSRHLQGFDTMCAVYAAPIRDTPAILGEIARETLPR